MSEKKVYASHKGSKISYQTRRRSNVTKRRPSNRYEAEEDSASVSASAKKLKVDTDDIDSLGGYTQNSNESFNSTVWHLSPKNYSSGKKILQIASDIAVCNFNDGLINVLRIMKVMDMNIGPQSYNFCLEADAARIQRAEHSLTDTAKEARSSIKASRKENEEEFSNLEGQLYGAGIAD